MKQYQLICPGCQSLGLITALQWTILLHCPICSVKLIESKDQILIDFYSVFAAHNKLGSKCSGCSRFIPEPLIKEPMIKCPYLDCCFVGNSLLEMRHPSKYLDDPIILTNKIKPSNSSPLRKIILAEQSLSYYSGNSSTQMQRNCIYQAFLNLLDCEEEQMHLYLLNRSRSGGFQAKLFQETISELDKKIPFIFREKKKTIHIASLLDPKLNIFDGISNFNGTVSSNYTIKNGTKEFYIGGRKSFITRPFYIGKLLSIIDQDKNISIMSDISSYSFSRIKLNKTKPGTKVNVSHLRIKPHYQMGLMTLINRIRKKIIQEAQLNCEQSSDEMIGEYILKAG